MDVIEETIEATLESDGQLRLIHPLRRGMADVIQEIEAHERLRGLNGRTVVELFAAFLCLVILSGCSNPPRTDAPDTPDEWFPRLTPPTELTSFDERLFREITGCQTTSVAIWIDAVDIDGDGREDAIVTLLSGEGVGPRAYLRTATTHILRGVQPEGAVFRLDESHQWFSLTTFWSLSHAKYPDIEVRRRFSLQRLRRTWHVRIQETRRTNGAGDSSTRGMRHDQTRKTLLAVEEFRSWKPWPGEEPNLTLKTK